MVRQKVYQLEQAQVQIKQMILLLCVKLVNCLES